MVRKQVDGYAKGITIMKLPPYHRRRHHRRPPSRSSYHLVDLAQVHSPPSSVDQSHKQNQVVG